MTGRTRRLGAVALLLLAACGSNDAGSPTGSAPPSTDPVTSSSPPTTAELPADPAAAPATTTPITTATTTPPTPVTAAVAGEVLTLWHVVQPYEHSTGSSFTEYSIESCFTRSDTDQPPFETPLASEPVPFDTVVRRGDVFICTIRTEPPADVGHLGLIVLDSIGTTATWGGSDDPEMPFLAAPGQLCNEFLADPRVAAWLTDPEYVASGMPAHAYTLALAYWFLDDQPTRMDVDRNGIPCEVLVDPDVVTGVLAGDRPRCM